MIVPVDRRDFFKCGGLALVAATGGAGAWALGATMVSPGFGR